MGYIIDQSVIDITTKCRWDFNCLNSLKCDESKMCELDFFVGNDTLFVKCPTPLNCNYKINFGDGHICSCPVRKEYYHKYKI